MAWVDTTTGREWRRNALNTAWVAPVFGEGAYSAS
jgi:hypothetical protein